MVVDLAPFELPLSSSSVSLFVGRWGSEFVDTGDGSKFVAG